jgi:hypothetical protein
MRSQVLRPPIKLRGTPLIDPPFDDELAAEVWAPADQPVLDWPGSRATRRGARMETRAERRPVSRAESRSEVRSGARPGSPPLPRPAEGPAGPGSAGAAGPAHLAVRRFVGMSVEVLNGYRPAAHLRRLALPREAAGVVAQGLSGARQIAELRRAAGRSGHRHARRPGPVAVLKLQLCEPRPGAVEACVLLVTGERTWAMMLRLEVHQQAWAATVLQLI